MTVAPNYPGFKFRDPSAEDHRVGQYLKVQMNLMNPRRNLRSTLEKHIREHEEEMHERWKLITPVETFPEPIPLAASTNFPVFRFYAYFRETVTDSNEETERIRFVRIHVFLEDDTVMIEENKARNSGIEQGTVLKRCRAPRPPPAPVGAYYRHLDFRLGTDVEIAGNVYRIYDCDDSTRDYFARSNIDVGTPEEPPADAYSLKRTLTERPIRVGTIDTDKTRLRQFLDYDGRVLRFYCYWDDRKSSFGELRKFVLHYFLADDRVEICQVLPPNSGRDPISRFLMKTQLFKAGTTEPLTDADLRIGSVVDVYNRRFVLYDADGFTREFIDRKYGKQRWEPLEVESEKRKAEQKREYPEWNGWGDEDDSLGYCNSLHPDPPKKDVVKFTEKDKQLIRFAAKFCDPAPQDVGRDFVVVYYLQDDTVSVFEQIKRNSGFVGGKFIQRAKIRNPDNSFRYYTLDDFRIGARLNLNGFRFVLREADEFALRYMEKDPDQFSQAELFDILQGIRQDKQKVERLRQMFEKVDPDNHGFVDERHAQSILGSFIGLDPHSITTIKRRFVDNGLFDYFSFFSLMA
jgi:hypothetical protein